MKLTHASVFSGIGGPEVAATMLGWENLFHCEINPFGKAVLDYWYPNAKSYEDITNTDFSEWEGRVNVLTGGFPCQPFSYAGQRRGATDDRYLWPYMFRCIDQVKPDWVVAENVAGILTMVEQGEVSEMANTADLFGQNDRVRRYRLRETFTLQRICDDLESHGYSVQPVLIPACAVGAPHRRDRVFIVGCRTASDTDCCSNGRNTRQDAGESREKRIQEWDEVRKPDESSEVRPASERDASSDTCDKRLQGNINQGKQKQERFDSRGRKHTPRCDRQNIRGNVAISESKCGEWMRFEQSKDSISRTWIPGRTNITNGSGRYTTDTDSKRLERSGGKRLQESKSRVNGETYACWDDGNTRSDRPEQVACGERWQNFPTVSPVHRGNDGIPFPLDSLTISAGKWRTEALKAYGNAIVPQVMYEIFRAIEKTYDSKETL